MAILLSVSGILGQSTFGGIVGVVKDPGEGTIADTQITLTNLDDRAQRTASADGNGAFEFVNVKPGHYELVIHADGFSDYKISSLQLDARQNLRLDVALKLATSAQTIEVSSELYLTRHDDQEPVAAEMRADVPAGGVRCRRIAIKRQIVAAI